MIHEVTASLKNIDFGATGVKEILQNVAFILATPSYSCPLDRDFAWTPDLDSPIQVAMARNGVAIVEAIRSHEPRAEVIEVDFHREKSDGDALDGRLIPVVKVRIADDTTI